MIRSDKAEGIATFLSSLLIWAAIIGLLFLGPIGIILAILLYINTRTS